MFSIFLFILSDFRFVWLKLIFRNRTSVGVKLGMISSIQTWFAVNGGKISAAYKQFHTPGWQSEGKIISCKRRPLHRSLYIDVSCDFPSMFFGSDSKLINMPLSDQLHRCSPSSLVSSLIDGNKVFSFPFELLSRKSFFFPPISIISWHCTNSEWSI